MVYSLQNPLPPIDCLVAALAAMEFGSFSAAAEALDITHASVSRRVATAENWVGYALFDRHARGVRPTLDGQRLLLRLQKTFGELESLAGRRTRDTARNVVRIQTTPSLARFWLIPRLEKFEAGVSRLSCKQLRKYTIYRDQMSILPSGLAREAGRMARNWRAWRACIYRWCTRLFQAKAIYHLKTDLAECPC